VNTVIEGIPVPVLIVSVEDAIITAANRAAREQWNADSEALLGVSLDRLLTSDATPDGHWQPCALASREGRGEPVRFEADLHVTGGPHRVLVVADVLPQAITAATSRSQPDREGEVRSSDSQAILLLLDVDSHHERELEADARRLRALIEANFDAYYDWHLDSGFHEWSAQMDRLLRLPDGSVFPPVLDAWVERLHPDEADQVLGRLQRSIASGQPYVEEYLLRTDDGDYRLVSDRGLSLADRDGRVTDLVGVIRDITAERRTQLALEESEELYRTLFKATSNPALRTDDAGLLLDANQAARTLLELRDDSQESISIREILGGQADRVFANLGGSAESGSQTAAIEATVTDGSQTRSLLFSVVPCIIGETATLFWLGTDVSDLRATTKALEDSQESLREQAQALQERAIALRVILEQGRQERVDLALSVQQNVEALVEPMLDRLVRSLAHRPEAAYVAAVRATLHDIVSAPSARDYQNAAAAAQPMAGLTRREREVLQLVRLGKTSDEIAATLHLSPATVNYHRKSIRRKLGLTKAKPRLSTFFGDCVPSTSEASSPHGQDV
jgi:PAS domain-containing protein/DNA-binding CsgD family transcriptional regulator